MTDCRISKEELAHDMGQRDYDVNSNAAQLAQHLDQMTEVDEWAEIRDQLTDSPEFWREVRSIINTDVSTDTGIKKLQSAAAYIRHEGYQEVEEFCDRNQWEPSE